MVGLAGIQRRILLYEPSESIGGDLKNYLGKEGFTVEHANTPQQTAAWADRFWYRAIILGMETVRDSKGLDGILDFLRQFPLDAPKILHMNIPSFLYEEIDQFRRKLKRSQHRVEIVKKTRYDEILEHLVEFQRDPMRNYNDSLLISSGDSVLSIKHIIADLEPDDNHDSFDFGSIQYELSDLLRITFECQSIQIEKIWWHEAGNVAAQIRTYYSNRPGETIIGVISKAIQEDTMDPLDIPVEFPKVIRPWQKKNTTHYSLTTYKLDGDPDWSELIPITDLLQYDKWDEFNSAIKRFQDYILHGWQKHHNKSTYEQNISIPIRQQLRLGNTDEVLAALKTQIQHIVDSPPNGEIGVGKDGNYLDMHLPDGSVSLPNPTSLVEGLLRKKYHGNLIHIPCRVDLRRIVVEKNDQKVWVTSLEGQGVFPRFWAETDLELSVRRMIRADHKILYNIEQQICIPKPNEWDGIPAGFLSYVNCIQLIRQNALLDSREHLDEYQTLLVFKLLKKFCYMDLNGTQPFQDPYQILIALSQNLYALMERGWIPRRKAYSQNTGIIEYDQANDRFMVNGRIFHVTKTSSELLQYLVKNPNRPIKYGEIARQVFNYPPEDVEEPINKNVRDHVQQAKSRLMGLLNKESPGFQYFQVTNNKYTFCNPPITERKRKRKRQA